MKRFAIIAFAAAALAATAARAFELCDVAGRSEEFYSSLRPLDKLSKENLQEMDSGLNAMLAAYEAGKVPDALVHRVFQGFATGYGDLEPRLRDWIAKSPGSRAAHLALAYHLTSLGWAARGSKYAGQTSPEQLAEAARYFRQAMKAYDEADALGRKPTLSIAQKIYMARSVGTLGLDAGRLYRDAIAKYPDTLQVRIRYIDASRPEWGGSVKQLESIIDDAKRLPPSDRRYIEYLVYQEIGAVYWCAEREGCGEVESRKGENARMVIGYFERSIPLCPGLDRALERLLRYESEMRDYTGVIGAATRLLQRKPRSAFAFSRRGMAYAKTGRYRDSLADYERATQLGDYAAFKELAWFYEHGQGVPKDPVKAIDLYMIADSHDVAGARKEAERLSKSSGIPLK